MLIKKTLNTIFKLFIASLHPPHKVYIHMVESFLFLLVFRNSSIYVIPNHAEYFNMCYLFLKMNITFSLTFKLRDELKEKFNYNG